MAHSPRYVADPQACLGVTGEAGECEEEGALSDGSMCVKDVRAHTQGGSMQNVGYASIYEWGTQKRANRLRFLAGSEETRRK
jgi:hypothetical protein